MLEALYKTFESMTVANEFNFDWETTHSLGNGSEALHDMIKPVGNIAFGDDENSENNSNVKYWLKSPLMITGMIDFNMTDIDLDMIDVQIQSAKIKMKQDIRKAFYLVSDEMNTAKIESLDYVRESAITSQAHIASVKLEFGIQWTEEF